MPVAAVVREMAVLVKPQEWVDLALVGKVRLPEMALMRTLHIVVLQIQVLAAAADFHVMEQIMLEVVVLEKYHQNIGLVSLVLLHQT